METPLRYLRLYLALARYGLAREFSFRMNFLVKVSVERKDASVPWEAIIPLGRTPL